MAKKELLFSVTKKDFDVQTFRAGGKGGQKQNKTESGVRIIHRESSAVGEARDSRHQLQNKKNAFTRLVASSKFKTWHKIKTAKVLGTLVDVDKLVNEAMEESNLKIEYGGIN